MDEQFAFRPPRRLGLTLHGIAILIFAGLSVWGLWQAAQAEIGPVFLLYILMTLWGVGIVPLLVYRGYALYRAVYILERNGIRIRWGLRAEDIPASRVLLLRHASQLEQPLPRPWISWPGAVLGVRRLSDDNRVEFLASRTGQSIVIDTDERIFVISPEQPDAFLRTYQRFLEMGSLTPLPARSVYPSFLLSRVWQELPARYLLLSGLILNLILLAWVSLIIPMRQQVLLGFMTGSEFVPAVQLLLLPVLSIIFYLLDVSAGLYFFRIDANTPVGNFQGTGLLLVSGRFLAYLFWGATVLTSLFFLTGLWFILRAS